MTAYDKHYMLNRDNLTQPFKMQLSQNQKSISELFLCFYNLHSILSNFREKMTLIADVFHQLSALENVVRSISKTLSSRGLFDREHGKCVETLLQSERQYLYNIF